MSELVTGDARAVTLARNGETPRALVTLVRAYLAIEEDHGPMEARAKVPLPAGLVDAARARMAVLAADMRPAAAARWGAFLMAAAVLQRSGPGADGLREWCRVAEEALAIVPAVLLTKERAAALARARATFPTPAEIVTWFQEEGGLRELWRERRALAGMLKAGEAPPARVEPAAPSAAVTAARDGVMQAVTRVVTGDASRVTGDGGEQGDGFVRVPARRDVPDEERPPPPKAHLLGDDALLGHYDTQAERGATPELRSLAAARAAAIRAKQAAPPSR